MNLQIRRFREEDAATVSQMIIRTLRISNSKDYPMWMLESVMQRERPEDQVSLGRRAHFYVAEDRENIIGCGAVGPGEAVGGSCGIYSIFTAPEYQGKGAGRRIMEALERDEYAKEAGRIELHASITGLGFYRKLGYEFKNGCGKPDENLLYTLEKQLKQD
ncbi:MAG: GNAT family N-acetyltransferase [Lachnospiraceae bacterium]|nr:GNAT family N-acetyltransferase [Lachnospiraceae bacterium]